MSNTYEKVKQWRKDNPGKVAAQARRYRAKHPEQRQAIVDRHRENNRDRIRELDREAQRRRREVDPEGPKRRIAAFKARKEAEKVALAGRPRPSTCDLCGEDDKTVFDHCHQQGHFRGWLCNRCNRVLGSVKDSVGLLKRMIVYLEQINGTVDGL